jgi:hypothetical protein
MNAHLASMRLDDKSSRNEAMRLLVDLNIFCGGLASLLQDPYATSRPAESAACLSSALSISVVDAVECSSATAGAISASRAIIPLVTRPSVEAAEAELLAAAARYHVEVPFTHDAIDAVASRPDGSRILCELRSLSRLADTAAYFERILPSLSASTHPRFVVIALRNLVGVFDDEDSALTAAADVRGEPLGALCVLHVDVTGELIAEESCAHVHQPLIIPASGIPRPQVQLFPSDLPDVPAISINVRNRGRRCLSDHYVGDIR